VRRLLIWLGLLAFAVAPAFAAATRIELLASAEQTASSNSAAMRVSTIDHAVVTVEITAGSGTVVFDCWLEASDDGGTSWYVLPADQVLESYTGATENTVSTNSGDIVDNKTTTAAASYVATYKDLSPDYIRVRWTLTGSTPALTFAVRLVGK
jgi:hypothetical protein